MRKNGFLLSPGTIMLDPFFDSENIPEVELPVSAHNGTGYLDGIDPTHPVQKGLDSLGRRYVSVRIKNHNKAAGILVAFERYCGNKELITWTTVGRAGGTARLLFHNLMDEEGLGQLDRLIHGKQITGLDPHEEEREISLRLDK